MQFMVQQRRMEMKEEEGTVTAGSILAKLKLEKYTMESDRCELAAWEFQVGGRVALVWGHL